MKNNYLSPKRDSEYLTVKGRRLEIAWHGPGPDEAPTLIFLHEGLGCVGMWRAFPAIRQAKELYLKGDLFEFLYQKRKFASTS